MYTKIHISPHLLYLHLSGHLPADIDHTYRLAAVIDSVVSYEAQPGSHRILEGFVLYPLSPTQPLLEINIVYLQLQL